MKILLSSNKMVNQVKEDEKASVDAAIEALKEATKAEDTSDIDAKIQALSEASSPIMERAYAQKSNTDESAESNTEETSQNEETVDAEFEEVDDSKDK